MTGVSQITVDADEAGMRLDRWFKVHFPGVGFGQLQKLLRSGQVRVDGGRVKTASRLEAGQVVRIPPLDAESASKPRHMTTNTIRDRHDADVLRDMVLYEDKKVLVFNKPSGLAVQGGSGISRSVDSMLESLRDKSGQKPRLCHRLDRDTSGVLVVAKTRGAAAALTKSFRHRDTQKTYWALVRGVPRHREGRISTYLVKEQTEDGDRMRIARHGERGADHAVSFYRVIDSNPRKVCWVEMQPHTGRTHQLRVHAQHLGHPIVGDPKYFDVQNWEIPGGVQKRLHLHARRIQIPHPDPNMPVLDVTAPLPPHMVQSWNLFGFEEADGLIEEDELK
ncbi:MAG: RluA family pseudouridine synthase [Rhizobiaceae bacterium]|nr:RluA family pseudouridine synthase [Hyphomicrobiales bacterium]NRB32391.1 RluA family pseudouridine synthase [Rhizobiaceae bacterium]